MSPQSKQAHDQRLWVNPIGGIYGLNYTVNLAQHLYQKGYNIYLDYHFSDSWADPGKQIIPAAWPQDFADLSSTLQAYVSDTLYAFHTAGVDLAMVSLGNEIRAGMLWPTGYVNVTIQPAAARAQNFTNLATLYKAARDGVDDAVERGATRPEYVLIHIDNGWDLALQQAWFAALTGSGIVSTDDWDLFGVSFYPFYGTQATLHNLSNTLNTLAEQYGKPLHVVETDWPAICSGPQAPPLSDTSVPVSAMGQTTWVQDIISVLDAVPNGLGQGLHYWEPAWLNNTGLGSACQDNVLFAGEYINATQTIGYSRTSVDMFH